MTKKKFLVSVAFAVVMALSCVFAGIGISRVHAAGNTEPTTVAAEDFKVSHIGVRFAEAGKTEHGLRFKVAISKSKLDALKADANVSNIAFKFSVAPQYLLKGVYVADSADALTYDIAEADWKVVTDGGAEYYEAAVYVSEIPQQAKFLQLAAQCVLTYTETIVIKDSANTAHDVSVPRTFCTAVQYASMADVAKYATDNNLTDADKVAAYLPGESVITYVSDGATVSTETATYGAKLDLPALTLNDGEYVVWKTADGKVWNKDFTAQGDITLTAEKGVYFGKVFEESAYRTATKVTDVAAPAGFEFVSKATAVGTNTTTVGKDADGHSITRPLNRYIHDGNFSKTTLDTIKTLKFAIKTNQTMNLNGLINDNSHDWLTFTLTQVSDDMWSLIVTDVAGNTVYSSATDKNVAGGLLNGARNDNSNYVDNALNTILFGNTSGFKPFGDLYRDLDVYVTEIRAEAKPVAVSGENILSSIYAAPSNESLMTTKSSSMAAPEGFTSVREITDGFSGPSHAQHETVADKYIHGRMNHDNISQFSEVHFALKSTAKFRLDNKVNNVNELIQQHYDDWLYFYLTKVSSGWEVKIVYQGKIIATFSNTGATICDVLWHGAAEGTTPYADAGESLTVYATEVRATRQTELAKVGEVINDKLYEGGQIVVKETAEIAPSGYDYVWQGNESKMGGESNWYFRADWLESCDISGYESLNFAIMNNYKFTIAGQGKENLCGWLYVTLTRDADNAQKWNVVVTNNGKQIINTTHTLADATKANELKYFANQVWWVAYTQGQTDPVYFTELRGTKKA